MVAETVAALGGLDIAVNNAGVNKNNAAEDTPEHEWDLTFNVNTKGLFLCCQVRHCRRPLLRRTCFLRCQMPSVGVYYWPTRHGAT